ncbi:MAG: hypothetical protein K2I42_00995 [Anaeroplasmataceae bacterium]|nr:hypothetical protein [Anaeroplasmataceae bacterium]
MQLNIEKHDFHKLEGIASIKNHLEKLSNVELNQSKAKGTVEINVSYHDFEGMECFKVLEFSFDLDLDGLKILEVNVAKVNLFVVEGQGLDVTYELIINYQVVEENAKEIELIKEDDIIVKTEKPVKEDPIEQIKEDMKEYYEDKLATNLGTKEDRILITKTNMDTDSFLNFFDQKQAFYKLKCLYVEKEEQLEKIAKEYNVKLEKLLAGYDKQSNKVIFSLE